MQTETTANNAALYALMSEDELASFDLAMAYNEPQVEDGETITAVYPSDESFWSELVSHHSKWIRSY